MFSDLPTEKAGVIGSKDWVCRHFAALVQSSAELSVDARYCNQHVVQGQGALVERSKGGIVFPPAKFKLL